MPSIEHTERFLAECLLYRAALMAKPLTRSEAALVKTRLSEVLSDLEEEQESVRLFALPSWLRAG